MEPSLGEMGRLSRFSRQTTFSAGLRVCHKTTDSIERGMGGELVVPFPMEDVAFQAERGNLLV